MSRPAVLSDLVGHSARRYPDRTAFLARDTVLTYADLDRQTNQLAHLLQSRGAGRGDRVAICLPSCLETPIAVYGVLKSGGAFVPIDPAAPVERIAWILADCGIRHIITSPELQKTIHAAIQDLPQVKTVVGSGGTGPNDVSWADVLACDPSPPTQDQRPDDVAYVMFTSGSTGTPKGIVHSHASGLAYVRASAETYAIRYTDVIGSTAPLHFDISTFSYLTAPFAGAATVIIPNAFAKLPASLSQVMADTKMTVFYTVPYALIQLESHGALEHRDLTAVRWVLFGGELFPPKKLAAIMDALPGARFSNSYGPAEVNQCTYFHVPVGARATDFDGQLPIGVPFGDARCLVLDGTAPVPVGGVGELVVAAPTMMKEYWQNPALNERAFYVDPKDGARYYRTGDAVFVDANSDFVMVGRIDRQVKLRGYRVELDEIELVFSKHPEVHEVAVYPIMETGLVVGLAANIILRHSDTTSDTDLIKNDLRKFCRTRLPNYAVPSTVLICDDLPRNSSGKIDRRALQQAMEEKDSVT